MRRVREADFDDYVEWYLRREERKGTLNHKFGVPTTPQDRLSLMKTRHRGKLRPWFPEARWSVVELGRCEDIERLICLDSRWTRNTGLTRSTAQPNYRLLRQYVLNAREINYFGTVHALEIDREEYKKRQCKLRAFRREWPQFRDDERLVICTPEVSEIGRNLEGTYYLHDGIGRLLPYLYMIYFEGQDFGPVEAFLSEQA